MANATNIAKFEKNINTKLEEMMEEVMQASLTVGETKAAVETVRSCPPPRPQLTISWLLLPPQ